MRHPISWQSSASYLPPADCPWTADSASPGARAPERHAARPDRSPNPTTSHPGPRRRSIRGLPMNLVFFSSRRRHTRCYRDWSSDVCSSDLTFFQRVRPEAIFHLAGKTRGENRSEERRVGKEGRIRWAPPHLKKKKNNN